MNKVFVLIFCGLSLLLWEVRNVRSQVLPSDQEILKRQALSRLQDREWLSTLRMTLWPSAYPEEPIYYGETNVTHQSGRTWYHLEAGGVWQQLHWLVSQPFLHSNKEQGRSDPLLGAGLHSRVLRDKIRNLILGGIRLPASDTVGEQRDYTQLMLAQKLFWELEAGQTLYLGLGYIRKGEDQVNYDPGDVTGFDFGFSSPVTNRDFQWQGGLLFVWQSSDKFRDTDLSTRENRVDLSLGAVLWQRLRFGFQWPLLTDSEFRQHAKRKPLGEVGYHQRF
ncbi:MAG: hypothetical protein VXW41_00840 [SAR324 cluster bacterium]|nr:hypothetical protein [SAR324 cluster bacterium]